jgi:hypothetical protein
MDRDIWTQAENQLIKELELCVWDDPPSIYGRGWDTGTLWAALVKERIKNLRSNNL